MKLNAGTSVKIYTHFEAGTNFKVGTIFDVGTSFMVGTRFEGHKKHIHVGNWGPY